MAHRAVTVWDGFETGPAISGEAVESYRLRSTSLGDLVCRSRINVPACEHFVALSGLMWSGGAMPDDIRWPPMPAASAIRSGGVDSLSVLSGRSSSSQKETQFILLYPHQPGTLVAEVSSSMELSILDSYQAGPSPFEDE